MEENKTMDELLKRLEQSNERQAKYARRQYLLSLLAALCCGVMLFLVWRLIPRVNAAFGQMETVLSNLEAVTDELAAADLDTMVENVDQLVTTSQDGVESAMDKLNAIDLVTLNRAIENLADVVEPLAKFFNVFNR